MEDTATVEAGPVVDTQAPATDSAPADVSNAQAPAASAPSIEELLKRGEENPNVVYTDAELDVIDKHYDSQANLKGKPKADPEPEAEDQTKKVESEAKETPEEDPPEPEKTDAEAVAPEIEAILKEVGAKSLKDAPAKIKELRRELSVKGNETAKVKANLDEITRSGQELWAALAKGDQNAIAFAEKTFGVKINGQQPQQQQAQSANGYIDPDAFIDPESAAQVNAIFQRQEEKIKAMEARFGTIEQERDRHIQESVKQQSVARVVEEMAELAQLMPEMKGINGFKEAAQSVLNGKADPRLDVFGELFDITAAIPGATLKDAFYIKRGKSLDHLTAVAKQEGIKQAYNVKPNPSLSGMTGGKGENSYQPVTPAQLEKWESDPKTHPASWYDSDDKPIQSRIPKGAWKSFGFK